MWRMAIHPTFQAIFILATLFNLYVLSLIHYHDDMEEMEKTIVFQLKCLELLNVAYFIEIVIKFIAFDLKTYFKSRMNIMELILFIIFLITFILD